MFLASCAEIISEDEAKETALEFIGKNVKFHTEVEEEQVDITLPKIEVLQAIIVDDEWRVLVKAAYVTEGKEVKKGLIVAINKKTGEPLKLTEVDLKQFD